MNDDRQQRKLLKESQRRRDIEAEHKEDGLTILIDNCSVTTHI